MAAVQKRHDRKNSERFSLKKRAEIKLQPKQDELSRLLILLEQAQKSLSQHWLRDGFVIELLLASVIARGHLLILVVPGRHL